jgi:hypothetical protein
MCMRGSHGRRLLSICLRQVVCQEHIVELSYALQSGFSEGYLLPDRTLPNYKSMAQVLISRSTLWHFIHGKRPTQTPLYYMCV